uniref:INCENP_ARK-bind domain-containing protein n=1 Tax=Ascaris lumbricoides TaxID=6252 RepID=A0A0M3I9V5_ASCLU
MNFLAENLRRALRQQRMHPPIDVDTFFGTVIPPDLQKLFSKNRVRYRQRTSSANWSSPLSNPTKGTSKYFAIQSVDKR